MNKQSFLIIHGLGGSGADHWQTWLADELTARNVHVYYPTFSNVDSPNKESWLNELAATIERIPKDRPLTIITHSLGCFLWLHYTAKQNKRIADHVVLVAPPSPGIALPAAASFFPVPLNRDHLLHAAGDTLFVHSTNDPYCSIEDLDYFSRLNVPSISLPNMGHINTDSGHGKWPWILDLCLTIDRQAVQKV